MIVVILDVIAGIFWAFVCGEEVRKKNYDPTAWYVLGFIFGGLAYLVAWWFIKPKIKEVDKVDIERIVQADKARAMKGVWILSRQLVRWLWISVRERRILQS